MDNNIHVLKLFGIYFHNIPEEEPSTTHDLSLSIQPMNLQENLQETNSSTPNSPKNIFKKPRLIAPNLHHQTPPNSPSAALSLTDHPPPPPVEESSTTLSLYSHPNNLQENLQETSTLKIIFKNQRLIFSPNLDLNHLPPPNSPQPVVEKMKKKRKKYDTPNPEPLPEAHRNYLIQGGYINEESVIKRVYTRALTATDVNPSQSRLSIPYKKLVEAGGVLMSEELEFLQQVVGEKEKKKRVKVKVLDPRLEIRVLELTKWNDHKKSSQFYPLTNGWNQLVKDNQLKEGHAIQVWLFRSIRDEDRDASLGFIVHRIHQGDVVAADETAVVSYGSGTSGAGSSGSHKRMRPSED